MPQEQIDNFDFGFKVIMSTGSSTMDNNSSSLNQHYLTALRKYEDIKDELDSLRSRHEDLLSTHSSTMNSFELVQEELMCAKKQLEVVELDRSAVTRERNGLKQQCTAAIRQWDMALRERNEYREAHAKVRQEHEETVKELGQVMNVRMKASKDLKRLTDERNAAMQESALIMSERDSVLKEMEKLSDDLTQSFKKNKMLEIQNKELVEEKKILLYQIETLKREIQSALHDRDRALKDCYDLRERFGEYTAKEESIQNTKSGLECNPYWEGNNRRKDDNEDVSNARDIYGKSQKERVDNLDQANQEIDKLRKQIDKLQTELTESIQEAEVSKRRRDWAFSERDKIVLERESIRTLCDSLRKERERAVSDLVVAIRDSDDIKKQRNEALKELKEIKEKLEAQLEKENQMTQFQSHTAHNHSHDSAIDADLHEWDVEAFDFCLTQGEQLGLELMGGRDELNIGPVYVAAVAKNSIADGKLRVHDCITRVNNMDCCNASKRAVLEALFNCGPNISIIVKRRRVGARFLYTTQLQRHRNLEHGLALEGGVYISKIGPGSLAAKEGNLAVGDRVLSINNNTIDGLKNAREAMNMLENDSDTITITTLKASSFGQNGSSEDDGGFGNWSRVSPKNDRERDGKHYKMVNSSSQTESRSFSPFPSALFTVSRSHEEPQFQAKPKPTIKEKLGALEIIREKMMPIRNGKNQKREDKKHREPSPSNEEYLRQQDDAIDVLDSVINIYHTKEIKKKEKCPEQNGGTWPKVRVGPIIDQGTGTVHHPKKTKVRQPITVVLSPTGSSYQPEVRTRPSRPDSQRPVSDFGTRLMFSSKPVELLSSRTCSPSLKEPRLDFEHDNAPSDGSLDFSATNDKGGLDYYLRKKSSKYAGSDTESGETGQHLVHPQLYVRAGTVLRSRPLYPYSPHPHPHPSPSHSGESITYYDPPFTPSQPFHSHSPSVDQQYPKARSMPPGHTHPNLHLDGFDSGTFPRKRDIARIRIPSNTSVTSASKVSTGSIERTSERGSPMPFYVEVISPKRDSKISDLWIQRPVPGELRKIHVEKFVEPLGIQIRTPDAGGVFVSNVNENSLASQVGLQVGDQLLEVCGINLRTATYALAANVLQQCRDSITMLVQYNPDKYAEAVGSHSSNDEDDRSRSGSPTPCNSPSTSRKSGLATVSCISTLPRCYISHTGSTLARQNPVSRASNEFKSLHEPRRLSIETKKCSDLGISLVGGNAVGIFVHRVQVNSLAHNAGLRTGDQILEYCGTDLRQATAEEAAYELAKPAEKVTILVLYNIDRYNEVKDKPGDSFYIRALFDRSGDLNESLQLRFTREKELRFHKDDVLYVDNTMLVPGYWWAWLVDEHGQKTQCGVIPSKYKVEEELLKRSMGDLEADGRRSTSSARRSFFKRKKHQRSSSRDSKELAIYSTGLGWYSDSGTLHEETPLISYLRVERLNYSIYRPVLVLGPLAELVTDRLLQDFPDKFTQCLPQILHCAQNLPEQFIDCRKKGNGNYYECTTIAAVRDICDKNTHCVLDISLQAVDILHKHQIYPIVLLIKFKSTKQIKEVKDTRYMDKVSAKAAKEMYEHALKLESEYRPLISAVIQVTGVNIAYMCTQIKSAIDHEQGKTLWVPSTFS